MWLNCEQVQGKVFDEGRLKLNHVARVSGSSDRTFLRRKDSNPTMWVDFKEGQEKFF